MKCHSENCKNKSIHLGYLEETDDFIDNAIQINQQYLMNNGNVEEIIEKWINHKKILAIKSPMGTGKTFTVKSILNSCLKVIALR